MPLPDPFDHDNLYVGAVRYSNLTVMLLPLPSGRVAVLDRSYTLRDVRETMPTLEELMQLSLAFNHELSQKAREDNQSQAPQRSKAKPVPITDMKLEF